MTLVPALALAALLAWSSEYGPARAAPAPAATSSPPSSGNHPPPPPPPPPPAAAHNASRGGGAVWTGARRGRRQAAEYGGWDSGRSSRIEPLFAEEPRFVLLERRETAASGAGGGAGVSLPVAAAAAAGPDGSDPFWVARGRRRRDGASSGSSFEEPFWAARGRRYWPQPRETSIEEPFWAARGRRVPSEDAWSRGRRAGVDAPRWRRRQVESVEEPFWATRGRRGPADSLSVEEPFWAARGKKGALAFQDLLSKLQWASAGKAFAPEGKAKAEAEAEAQMGRGCRAAPHAPEHALWEPSGRRGKRGSQEFRDLLSKVRPRGASVELDPFWAARGKRVGAGAGAGAAAGAAGSAGGAALGDDADANADDDLFWSALERRTAALAGR